MKPEYFYRDKYTTFFNHENENGNKNDLMFLNYSTSQDFVFNSEVFRNRLVYMNSFDNCSLKITKFIISPIGMTMRNKPILTIIMNNSDCYLLSYHIENSINEFKIVNFFSFP